VNLTKILPDYPRTQHLCHKPNAQRLDLIASDKESQIIFNDDNTFIEDKVDGANCGICFFDFIQGGRWDSRKIQKNKLK